MNVNLKLRSMPAFLLHLPKLFFQLYRIHRRRLGRIRSARFVAWFVFNSAILHAKSLKKRQGGVFLSIGTKSVLYGYHCFFIHPFFVAWAWWKLYGFPTDPRLWVAFFVHDLGYWGKPNMDGLEGETHPALGANIMGALFDSGFALDLQTYRTRFDGCQVRWVERRKTLLRRWSCESGGRKNWFEFTLYHSRFLAKKHNETPSQLCVADKFAIILYPVWFQLFLMRLSGELTEYIKGENGRTPGNGKTARQWVGEMKAVLAAWMEDYFFDCSACVKTFSTHEVSPLTIPPAHNSTDGLPRVFCPKCAADYFSNE